jgi:PPM family protein phosphatase
VTCTECGQRTYLGDRFCEACGAVLFHPGCLWSGPDLCPVCSAGRDPSDQPRCAECGSSWSEGETRWQVRCDSTAAVSDRGLRRARNEDSCAVARDGELSAIVVCDGIASSDGADIAAAVAARTAIAVLRAGMSDFSAWPSLVATAATAAQQALEEGSVDGGSFFDGATTIAAALTRPGEIVVGNVGDSRAYWVDRAAECELLTVDDSEGNESSHVLNAWLGAGAGVPETHIAVRRTSSEGWLVVCSDGLWNYAPLPADIAALITADHPESPEDLARRLADFAIAAGGADNITVAVVRVHPPAGTKTRR